MKSIIIVASVLLVACVSGAPNDNSKKCDGTEIKFTDEVTKAHEACKAKYVAGMGKHEGGDKKTKEGKDGNHHGNKTEHHMKGHDNKNMTCMAVCNFQAFGIIDKDGKIAKDNIAPAIKANFPASVQDALTASITACFDKNGANVAITADGNCDSYEPLLKCSWEATDKACKWEKGDKKN